MRVFHLQRDEDESGVSGVGRVAEGVEFGDGQTVIKWNGNTRSLNIYESVEQVERVHGHHGKTRVVFD